MSENPVFSSFLRITDSVSSKLFISRGFWEIMVHMSANNEAHKISLLKEQVKTLLSQNQQRFLNYFEISEKKQAVFNG